MSARRLINISALLCTLAAALALIALAGASQALAAGAPRWDILSSTAPTHLIPGKQNLIDTVLVNLGDASVEGTAANPIVFTEKLPAGVEELKIVGETDTGVEGNNRYRLNCSELRCTYVGKVPPFISLEILTLVEVTGTGYLGQNEVKVEGGNAPPQAVSGPLTTSSAPTPFGIESYEMSAEEESGSRDLQAGSHPFQLTTTLAFNKIFAINPLHPNEGFGSDNLWPGVPALLRNLNTRLPAGLIGNPVAIPTCSEVDFTTLRKGNSNTCPANTAVGVAVVTYKEPEYQTRTESVPVFNLAPAPGEPARFGFEFDQVPVTLDTSVKTGEGYAVEARTSNATQAAEVMGTIVTIWGVPGDPSHDSARGWACLGGGHFVESLEPRPPCNSLGTSSPPPYLTLPTTCAQPLSTFSQAQAWTPGAPLLPPVEPQSIPTLQGCGSLPFDPSIALWPDQSAASTPSGLNVEVRVPQETTLAANGLAEADVKATTLTLPEGLQASAGAADGLETCSVGQAGFSGLNGDSGPALEGEIAQQRFTAEGVSCPDASKVGTVSIHSPVLENDMKGYFYLAQQNTDPFTSPLVAYLVAEDPVSGVRVKLAGEVKFSPTGQLTSVFQNTPPLPFETLKIHLFDGPRASQATPAYCRPYETVATFNTWSSQEPTQRSSSFTPTSGPNGTPCQSSGPLPFGPAVQAGSTNNQAGAYSPFTFTVARPDGQQGLTGVAVTLPEGMAGKLSSLTPCQEPPVGQEWSCGADSLIGHATTSSGLGPDPVTLTGQAYLTTGYDGAPFGLLVSTLAKAGPFNLGMVNVRSRINVDKTTAAVTVTTDPGARGEALPTILKGVPVQLKALNVTVDRPQFQFNPTNCAPLSVTGTLAANEGGNSTFSTPFQVANCASLPFTPKLTATVGSQASKVNGASLNVKIESAGLGQANIQKVFLTIPGLLPSRLDTIQKACPDYVFEKNPAGCGEGSVIGKGTVHTQVLKNPLVGPAYLVSHANRAFPDVVFVLQGEGITLVVTGHTDIKNGVTYSRFESAPDAPFTSFETELPTGPHSALTAYVPGPHRYDLCGQKVTIPTEITAQDGAQISQNTQVTLTGCPPKISVTKTKSKGATVQMTLSLSVPGSVTISGKGLKTTTKRGLSAGTHAITVQLSKSGVALRRAHRKLAASVRLSAAGATAATTASFR